MVLCATAAFLLLILPDHGKFVDGQLMTQETLSRRNLNRFRINHPDNEKCWDRRPEKDSFFNVIDVHNHFRPFGPKAVDFNLYMKWMEDAGILFSTMFGIGQLIKPKNANDPKCCYYLHCPTFDYPVVPDPKNDKINAQDYTAYNKKNESEQKIVLTLSATFPNLQKPGKIIKNLDKLEAEFPGAFQWAGEINVIKHALVGNGFFKEDTSPRITKRFLEDGNLDPFFKRMETKGWPVTLHCDFGCDNYDAIPDGALDNNPIKRCVAPNDEIDNAKKDFQFWKDLLGEFYPAFFDQVSNAPYPDRFRKVQHLHLMDTICNRYPMMKVVWPHLGLSKELKGLHPRVWTHIMEFFLKKHPNLYFDLSWDILSKLLLMNYDENTDVQHLSSANHDDIHYSNLTLWNQAHIKTIDEMRQKLHEKWDTIKDTVHASGSKDKLNGPTHAFAILLDLIEMHPDRFLAGTDFVASMGDPFEFPGLKKYKKTPTGCNKDPANHRRQVTDTSAINIFFSDTVFRKVVLGENYFKVTGLASQFVAPKVCEEEVRDTKETSKAHRQMPHVLLVLLLSRFGFGLF